jgi:DNA polymerase III delta subunit
VYDALEDDPAEIASELFVTSMFASDKVLLVRGIERASGAFFEPLLPFLEHPVSGSHLLITGESYPKEGGNSAFKKWKRIFSKKGHKEEFKLKDFDAVSFVKERAKSLGVSIQQEAVLQLVRDTGAPSILENELLKLSSFVETGKSITAADVSKVCEISSEIDVWALTNALVARDVDAALQCLHRMLKEQNPPHKIFALVMSKVRDLSVLQQHISQRTPLGNSWRHTATREQAIALLRKNPMQIGQVLQKMVTTNRNFNSSKADAEEHLHALIVSLCLP